MVAGAFIMAKIAEMEGRSPIAWGGITVFLCLGSSILVPLPIVDIGIGLALAFGCMVLAKGADRR